MFNCVLYECTRCCPCWKDFRNNGMDSSLTKDYKRVGNWMLFKNYHWVVPEVSVLGEPAGELQNF